MCFSASASFTAGAFLVPTGLFCIYSALELKRYHYLALALVPLCFGIQQLIEGGVWLSIAAQNAHWIHVFSVGFLFFSHFFWPFWIPLSAYLIAKHHNCPRAWIKLVFVIVGTILGLLAFIPFATNPNSVQTQMCANSIQYHVHTVLDAVIGTRWPKYVYIAVIILPLWISRDWAIKLLGLLIFISVIVTYWLYSYAFNSVWCFFSAVLSIYIVYIIRREKESGLNVKVVE